MNIKKLVFAATLGAGFISCGLAMAGGMGMTLGSTPPTSCGASGGYECYKFMNETNVASPLANGLTIQVVLAGTGSCNQYQWYIPAGQTGWLWSNPAAGGCVVSSVAFSAPAAQNTQVAASALPAAPLPFTVVSQGAQGSKDTTAFNVQLSGTATATSFNIQGPFVYAVHHNKK